MIPIATATKQVATISDKPNSAIHPTSFRNCHKKYDKNYQCIINKNIVQNLICIVKKTNYYSGIADTSAKEASAIH
jgi:hypothetical protein